MTGSLFSFLKGSIETGSKRGIQLKSPVKLEIGKAPRVHTVSIRGIERDNQARPSRHLGLAPGTVIFPTELCRLPGSWEQHKAQTPFGFIW